MGQRTQLRQNETYAILYDAFSEVAQRWIKKRGTKDLDRIAVSFHPTTKHLMLGNRLLIDAFIRAAVFPEEMNSRSHPHAVDLKTLLLTCYSRSPDFTLHALTYFRKIAMATSIRTLILRDSFVKSSDEQYISWRDVPIKVIASDLKLKVSAVGKDIVSAVGKDIVSAVGKEIQRLKRRASDLDKSRKKTQEAMDNVYRRRLRKKFVRVHIHPKAEGDNEELS